MPVSDSELEQAVALIAHDLAATLGWRTRQASTFAKQTASAVAAWWDGESGIYATKVAEYVQQQLHDTFVDTTWPACPLHRRHPLWLEHDRVVWRCTQSGRVIAPLGSLSATS
jgi:hypothetical protein